MPKVGEKEFSYSDKGKAKAKAYAKKTEQEVEYPTYDAGERVKVYREGGEVKNKKDLTKGITDESIEEMYIRINEKKALENLEKNFLNLEKKGKGKVKYKGKKDKGNIA